MLERVIIKTAEEWGGSYDEIHDVIYQAHEMNRQKGINYKSALLDGEEIKKRVGDGMTFVAVEDGSNRAVGTGSVSLRKGKYWFDKGYLVAHFCLAAVIPEYYGRGLMIRLYRAMCQFSVSKGAKLIRTGTAEPNIVMRDILVRLGFVPVDYLVIRGNGFYSVMLVKWLDDSVAQKAWKCKLHLFISKVFVHLKYNCNGEKTIIGRILSVKILQTLKRRKNE